MPEPVGAAPAWRWVLLGLVALLLLPAVPVLPVLAPIPQAAVLLVPAIAACALVGWWQGGRPALAVIWVAAAVWLLTRPLPGSEAFASLARGWGVLLAAVFGALCVLRPRRGVLDQALVAVALTFVVALVVLLTLPGAIGADLGRLLQAEYASRVGEWRTWITTLDAQPAWMARFREPVLVEYARLPDRSVAVLPAALALQSLGVLAVAWALYQRLGRVRIGPPMGRLRDFRFSDQLVWGLIVGITLVLVEAFGELRGAGINLLVFFGALYVVRGAGVLAWLLGPKRWARVLLVTVGVIAWQLLAPFALVLGVGDTWLDWRGRTRPTS